MKISLLLLYLFFLVTMCIPGMAQFNTIEQDTLLLRVYYDCIHKYDKKDTLKQFHTSSILMIGQTRTRFSNARFDNTSPLPEETLNPPKLTSDQIKKMEAEWASRGVQAVTLDIENRLAFNERLFRFYDSNTFVMICSIGYNDFKVQIPVPDIQWEIASDTKNIGKIECQKATCFFAGRQYTAWFAPSIPFPYGPWKLGGLPGLILEVTDSKNEVKFVMTKMLPSPKKNRFLYYEALRPKLVSEKEFEKEKERYFKDPVSIHKSQLRSDEVVKSIQYEDFDGTILKDGKAINAIKTHSKIRITNPIEILDN
ncbi:MAG: GLPGLI family protein [Siphonobacter sp.]